MNFREPACIDLVHLDSLFLNLSLKCFGFKLKLFILSKLNIKRFLTQTHSIITFKRVGSEFRRKCAVQTGYVSALQKFDIFRRIFILYNDCCVLIHFAYKRVCVCVNYPAHYRLSLCIKCFW